MKRYIIFAYDTYRGCGGHEDIVKHEDNLEEAITFARKYRLCRNKEIYDCELEEVVWEKS